MFGILRSFQQHDVDGSWPAISFMGMILGILSGFCGFLAGPPFSGMPAGIIIGGFFAGFFFFVFLLDPMTDEEIGMKEGVVAGLSILLSDFAFYGVLWLSGVPIT